MRNKTDIENLALDFAFLFLEKNVKDFVNRNTKTFSNIPYPKRNISLYEIEKEKKEIFDKIVLDGTASLQTYQMLININQINRIFDNSFYFLLKKLILELEHASVNHKEIADISISQGIEEEVGETLLFEKINEIVEANGYKILICEYNYFSCFRGVDFKISKSPDITEELQKLLKEHKDLYMIDYENNKVDFDTESLVEFVKAASKFIK